MKILFTVVASICIVLCTAQTGQQPLLAAKLDASFSRLFKPDEPGGSILIQQYDKVLYKKSFGLADIKTTEKFSSSTLANVGSVSKTFVAYGILLLAKQGKLSLDDNMLHYFPGFKNKEIAAKVTIRHLLTHTSGLPDCRNTVKDSIFYLTAKDQENFYPITQTDTLEFEPGSNWNYSNPAYNGLALIIEKVSGIKWQDFIRKNIFIPAGMQHSKIQDGPYPQHGVSHGYRFINHHYEEYDYGEYPTFPASGNGGVWSSIEDLKKYVDAINRYKFTDSATIAFSKTTWTPDNWLQPQPMFHSPVWFVHPGFYYDAPNQEQCLLVEHSGDQAGFKAHLIMIPENCITVIWITNNDKIITEEIRKALWEAGYLK